MADCKRCGGHKLVNNVKDRICFQCIETENKIKQLEDGIEKALDKHEATKILKYRISEQNEKVKQLEEEIAEWKLKYIAVCEKKDLSEQISMLSLQAGDRIP